MYSINMIDTETPPAWISLCETFRPASQDSGRCRFFVTTSKHDDLIDALEADDDVIEYSWGAVIS